MRGDRQSNEEGAAVAPTAVYWKLQRILKPSNLNGSSAVMSLSPCPPPLSLCTAQPFYPYTSSGLTVHTARNRDRRGGTAPPVPLCWAFAAAAVGFY